MAVQVEIHSTAKRAFLIVGFAVALAGLALGLRYLRGPRETALPSAVNAARLTSAVYTFDLTPVVILNLPPDSKETTWAAELAKVLNGRTETQVQNGRVDVLTDRFAIEVERLEKWHEGIGQSLHYSDQTGKLPCIALIVADGIWPIGPKEREEIKLVEDTAQKRGIRVFILRRNSDL